MDRFGVLLDLWNCMTTYLECKREVIIVLLTSYSFYRRIIRPSRGWQVWCATGSGELYDYLWSVNERWLLGPRLARRVPYSNHSVCPSVCLSVKKTLTLAITSLLLEISLSYLACVILMTRPFQRYHKFWTCDLDRDLWPTFEKL